MEIQDDRTSEERETHYVLIGGTDRVLSGWGKAQDGMSYAFWACTPEDSERVRAWVQSRGDIIRVRTVYGGYKPSLHCAHCHIYAVSAHHPALNGGD